MSVNLVLCGIEQDILLRGIRRRDIARLYDPDADPLVAAGVDIARVSYRALCVGRVQAADVLVSQAMLATDEDLPERPLS